MERGSVVTGNLGKSHVFYPETDSHANITVQNIHTVLTLETL